MGDCVHKDSSCHTCLSFCLLSAFKKSPMHRRNLTLLEKAGAELVFFSPMHDVLPHGVSGIYFGGGCPERSPDALAANGLLMAAVAAFAEAGGVIYAEYAGLVYLSQSLQPVGNLPYAMGKPNMIYCFRCAHIDGCSRTGNICNYLVASNRDALPCARRLMGGAVCHHM